jgi:hypothetical protein
MPVHLLSDALKRLDVVPWLARGEEILDEMRRLARQMAEALWVLMLVTCCTTPVLLHSAMLALTARPPRALLTA